MWNECCELVNKLERIKNDRILVKCPKATGYSSQIAEKQSKQTKHYTTRSHYSASQNRTLNSVCSVEKQIWPTQRAKANIYLN